MLWCWLIWAMMAMDHPTCLRILGCQLLTLLLTAQSLNNYFFHGSVIKLVDVKNCNTWGRVGGPIFSSYFNIFHHKVWTFVRALVALMLSFWGFFTLEIKRWDVQRSPICSHRNNKWSRWPKSLCTGAQWQALSGWQQISTEQNSSSVETSQLAGKGHHLGMRNFSEKGWWNLFTAIDCGNNKSWYDIALRVLQSYFSGAE